MTRPDFLKSIAETAYNVGFGAKKHFATYDITDKVPSAIGFVSTGVGVFALFMPALSTNVISAAFIVLGVLGISISLYDHKKDAYAEAGTRLTDIFNRLKWLYFNAKSADDSALSVLEAELVTLESELGRIGISDQIMFSGWYAHYKFFWEQQIGWIDEQKHFRLFRDKVPLSLTLTMAVVVTSAAVVLFDLCASSTSVTP